MRWHQVNRRTTAAGAASLGMGPYVSAQTAQAAPAGPLDSRRARAMAGNPRVALVKGTDRRANMLKAVEMIASQIKEGVKGKQVVIKPNLTRVAKQEGLAAALVWSEAFREASFANEGGKLPLSKPLVPYQESAYSTDTPAHPRFTPGFTCPDFLKHLLPFQLFSSIHPWRHRIELVCGAMDPLFKAHT